MGKERNDSPLLDRFIVWSSKVIYCKQECPVDTATRCTNCTYDQIATSIGVSGKDIFNKDFRTSPDVQRAIATKHCPDVLKKVNG